MYIDETVWISVTKGVLLIYCYYDDMFFSHFSSFLSSGVLTCIVSHCSRRISTIQPQFSSFWLQCFRIHRAKSVQSCSSNVMSTKASRPSWNSFLSVDPSCLPPFSQSSLCASKPIGLNMTWMFTVQKVQMVCQMHVWNAFYFPSFYCENTFLWHTF